MIWDLLHRSHRPPPRRTRRRGGRSRAAERGSNPVEFAIIGSVLVVLAIGIIEFGRAFFLRNDMSYVADVATRLILMNSAAADSTVRAAAKAKFDGDPNDLTVTFGTETASGVNFRTVTLTHPLTLMVPFLANNSMTLTVARRVPI